MKQVNAIGDTCPLPVIKTKKALSDMTDGQLEVLVDNEIAVQNVRKYATSAGANSNFSKQGDHFVINIEKTQTQQILVPDALNTVEDKIPVSEKTTVVISSDCMGSGDDNLGAILMKGFIFALTQLDLLPDTVLLYNAGARLSVEGSAVLNDLIVLNNAGVKILTCGTCLNHFELADKLGVGEVTNMYSIVESMRNAERILRP